MEVYQIKAVEHFEHLETNSETETEFEIAETEFDIAETEVEHAETEMEIAETEFEKTQPYPSPHCHRSARHEAQSLHQRRRPWGRGAGRQNEQRPR